DNTSRGRPPTRWWPVGIILLLAGVAFAAIRLWPKGSFQERNLWTAQAVVWSLLLLLLWTLAFSRLPWRIRWRSLGLVIAAIGSLALCLRIRGVSGDLLPILEWRYQAKAEVGRKLESP